MKATKYIYSANSVEALEVMFAEFADVFNFTENINDLFYYGVFCKPEMYANYPYWDDAPVYLDIPICLTAPTSKSSERLDYVEQMIGSILKGEEEKPEWMYYVEETLSCEDKGFVPSNFLYLIPKEEQYERLGEVITDFLYSPDVEISLAGTKGSCVCV